MNKKSTLSDISSVFARTLAFMSVLAIITVCNFQSSTALGQGVMLRGSGAVNESMGGAATACPLDSAGALYWNPASIAGLKQNEMSMGLGVILPETRVSSSIRHPDFGLIADGSTEGEAGSVPVPNMSVVWRPNSCSRWTYGVSMGAVGGAATLYASTGDPFNNPILGGLSKSSTVVVMQVTPTVAYKVNNKLSIGAAPVIDLAALSINPMQLGQPLGANNEIHNYGTRYAWGGGFQLGAYYDFQNHFKTGFTYKSPVWVEPLRFEGTRVGTSAPVSGKFDFDTPTILSWGISYDGLRNTVLAIDVRYFDYAGAAGFEQGVNADNVVMGLGWDSIFSVAAGAQRKINDRFSVRMGYCWNENPIPSKSAALNVAAPLMGQHTLSCGATFEIMKDLDFSFTYSHVFTAELQGNFDAPIGGAIGNVTSEVYADVFMAGITKRW